MAQEGAKSAQSRLKIPEETLRATQEALKRIEKSPRGAEGAPREDARGAKRGRRQPKLSMPMGWIQYILLVRIVDWTRP